MKKFFEELFRSISKFDFYVNHYKTQTKIINLPSVAYVNWGLYLAEIGLVDEAIEKFKTSSEMAYPASDAFVNLAIALAQEQKFDAACANLKKAVKADPTNVKAYCLWGSILSDRNEYDESEKLFKKANKLAPKNADVYLNWGISLAKQNKKTEAKEKFKNSLYYDSMNIRAIFFMAVLDMESGLYNEALMEFKRVLEYSPTDADAYHYLAFCALSLEDLSHARLYAKESLKLNPQKLETYVLLSDCYLRLNDKENCLRVYELADANCMHSSVLYSAWGLALQNFKEYEFSNEILRKSLQDNPHDFNVLFIKAINYVNLDNQHRAKELLEYVVELSPKHTDALFNLGLVYHRLGDYYSAIKSFETAMGTERKTEYMYYHIANSYFAKGEHEAAAGFYAKSIEYNPKDVPSLVSYANLMVELNNYNEALRKIRTAYQVDRQSPRLNYLYGLILFKCENYKEALDKFEQTLELDENYADAQYGKAESLVYSDKVEDAIDYLRELLEISTPDIKILYLLVLAYYKLALKIPSDYNIGTAMNYCDKIIELNAEDTFIKERKQQLSELLSNK